MYSASRAVQGSNTIPMHSGGIIELADCSGRHIRGLCGSKRPRRTRASSHGPPGAVQGHLDVLDRRIDVIKVPVSAALHRHRQPLGGAARRAFHRCGELPRPGATLGRPNKASMELLRTVQQRERFYACPLALDAKPVCATLPMYAVSRE